VIAVFMMNGQEVAVCGIKLSTTAAADQTVQGQSPLSVLLPAGLLGRLDLPDDLFGRSGYSALVLKGLNPDPSSPASISYAGHISPPIAWFRGLMPNQDDL
jgi:hypothetical protein